MMSLRVRQGRNESIDIANLLVNAVILCFTWEIVKLNRQNVLNNAATARHMASIDQKIKPDKKG